MAKKNKTTAKTNKGRFPALANTVALPSVDQLISDAGSPQFILTQATLRKTRAKLANNLPTAIGELGLEGTTELSSLAHIYDQYGKTNGDLEQNLATYRHVQNALLQDLSGKLDHLVANEAGVPENDFRALIKAPYIWAGAHDAVAKLSETHTRAPEKLRTGVNLQVENAVNAGLDVLSLGSLLVAGMIDTGISAVTDGYWELSPVNVESLVSYWVGDKSRNTLNLFSHVKLGLEGATSQLDEGTFTPKGSDVSKNVGLKHRDLKVRATRTQTDPEEVDSSEANAATMTQAISVNSDDLSRYEQQPFARDVILAQFVNVNPRSLSAQCGSIRMPVALDTLGLNVLAPLGADVELQGKKDGALYSNSSFNATRRDLHDYGLEVKEMTAKYLYAVPTRVVAEDLTTQRARFDTKLDDALINPEHASTLRELGGCLPCGIGYTNVTFEDVWFTVNEGVLTPLFMDDVYDETPLLLHAPSDTPISLDGGRLSLVALDQPDLASAYSALFRPVRQWRQHVPQVQDGIAVMKLRIMHTPAYRIIVACLEMSSKMTTLARVRRDLRSTDIQARETKHGTLDLVRVPLFENSMPITEDGLRADLEGTNPTHGEFDPEQHARAPMNSKIALVGATGAGKTTTAILISQWATQRGKAVVWVSAAEPNSLFVEVMYAPQYEESEAREQTETRVRPTLMAELHAVDVQTLDGLVAALYDRGVVTPETDVVVIIDSLTPMLNVAPTEGQSNSTSSGGVNPATRKALIDLGTRHYPGVTIVGLFNLPIDKTGNNFQQRMQIMGAVDVYCDKIAWNAPQRQKNLAMFRARDYGVMNKLAHLVQRLQGDYGEGREYPDVDIDTLAKDHPELFEGGLNPGFITRADTQAALNSLLPNTGLVTKQTTRS